ncbi:MAG TPA: DUF2167 domain-containing protein [Vicinamibacterales bacterium]|jgi:uncharacterized membrane-anchored protein|nr:DUF2167 domain-containing protein [Vicinamibacterales bacterium]
MQRSIVACVVGAAVVLLAAANVRGQEPSSEIRWQSGPATGSLGDIAQIKVPEGFRFTGKSGTRTFLELTQNPTNGDELGILLPESVEAGRWFVVFEFNPIGYVKDDEKDKLDADDMISNIKRGTEAANEERKKRGWATMSIVGWHTPPFYDTRSNNLTWAITGAGDDGQVVNYSIRLLGRHGVMNVDLVLSPEEVDAVVPAFEKVLGGFSFKPGSRYAEFVQGDKVAAYGLTALVAGGAGAALAKSGLLGKLWKAIVVGVLALIGAIKKMFGGRSGDEPQPANT